MSSELPPQLPANLPPYPVYPEAMEAGEYLPPMAQKAPPESLPMGEPIRKIGPGVLISFCWLIGVFVAQFLFAVVAVAIIIGVNAANGVEFEPTKLTESSWANILLLGSSQFAIAFVALIAAVVHARKNTFERLQLYLPQARHWAFAILGIIPMSIIATEAAIIVGKLDGFSLKLLEESVRGIDSMPIVAMLAFGCVFPGLFEELLFRGVMGRGMTERHGVWVGVTFASIFFGVAHLVPAHAVSAAIMGVFLHLAFLYSRSFWVPVLMHVVNNALAFLTSRYDEFVPIPGYTTDLDDVAGSHVPAPLLASGALAAIALVACWRYFRSAPATVEKQALAPINEQGATIPAPLSGSAGIAWLLIGGLLASQSLLMAVMANSIEK
jgi:uncharacterized protein